MSKKGALGNIGMFTAFPHDVINSEEFASLSPNAVKLLVAIMGQCTIINNRKRERNNNGLLSPAWALMKKRGFRSQTTLDAAKKELRASNFITVTRQGRRGRQGDCELWALNWFPLGDDPDNKMEIKPSGHNYKGYLLKNMKIKTRDEIRERKLVKEAMRAAAR